MPTSSIWQCMDGLSRANAAMARDMQMSCRGGTAKRISTKYIVGIHIG
jgi:hypothetical protein